MQMSDEELALIKAIHADPRNDILRLIYADWLEERGNPMADLIRWQVATRRRVYIAVGRKGLKDGRIMDRRKYEKGMETSDDPFYSDLINQAILPQVNEWVRPFPRESSRQVFLYKGIATISWDMNTFGDLKSFDTVFNKILPRIRLDAGIIRLNNGLAAVEGILSHPLLGRIDRFGIRMDDSPETLIEFMNRFAESSLPDRIEWMSLLGHAESSAIDEVFGG